MKKLLIKAIKLINRIYYRIISMFFSWAYSAKNLRIRGKVYIECPNVYFGANVKLWPGVNLTGNGKIIIGDNVVIGKDSIIFAGEEVIIGNNSGIAAHCYIIDSNHGIERDSLISSQDLLTSKVVIGEDVWIAAGCQILPGSHVENGSVIGAGTVLNKKVKDYTIVHGVRSLKTAPRRSF